MDNLSKDYWIGSMTGILVGVSLGMASYLVSVSGHDSYGFVIFFLLPFLTGFSVAAIVRPKAILAVSMVTVAVLCASILIVTGLEGYICVAMAAPFMAFGMTVGAVVGYLLIGRVRERRRLGEKHTILLLALVPALMAAAEHAERPLRTQQRVETFATTIHVDAPPERTWDSLTDIPQLTGPKPFLLAVGLPVPTYCRLGAQEVGAERVCGFDQGEIVQRVADWQPNASLRVDVVRCTLPGRRWLQFHDASYELTPTPAGTTVTRYSTIGSRLYPRWYWRRFEAWAVASEHEYVLANIKRIAEGE